MIHSKFVCVSQQSRWSNEWTYPDGSVIHCKILAILHSPRKKKISPRKRSDVVQRREYDVYSFVWWVAVVEHEVFMSHRNRVSTGTDRSWVTSASRSTCTFKSIFDSPDHKIKYIAGHIKTIASRAHLAARTHTFCLLDMTFDEVRSLV